MTTPTVPAPCTAARWRTERPGGCSARSAKQLLDIVERSPFTAVQAIAAVYLASGR
jgi:hypothetical protein